MLTGLCCQAYLFLYGQSAAKIWVLGKQRKAAKELGESAPTLADIKYRGKGGSVGLAADRTVGNFYEQAPLLILGVLLYAYMRDAGEAAKLGWMWIAFRLWYPFGFKFGTAFLLMSTLPGYAVVGKLWYGALNAALLAAKKA
eukprot:Hpha_TRINITY_DN16413_c0_g1::TRINITY_DN16413_c0_g1_i2::g.160467::m.160467